MKMATVIGRVTLSTAEPSYRGGRFLLCMPITREQMRSGDFKTMAKESSFVAYDNLGASVGDLIGYSDGAEATATFTTPTPIDAFNCAIINETFYNPPKE